MKLKFSYILLLATVAFSCNSGSDSEEARLEEALKVHNESLAIFSETLLLLDEVTEMKAELVKKTGAGSKSLDNMLPSDTANQDQQNRVRAVDSLSTSNNASQNNQAQNNTAQDSLNQNQNQAQNNQGSTGNEPAMVMTQDTTHKAEATRALDSLNQVQGELLTWMRNVYKVPGMDAMTDSEKTEGKQDIGMDPNARTLKSDIQFKEFEEGVSADKVYEKQQEMKEEILRIREDLEKALNYARSVSITAGS